MARHNTTLGRRRRLGDVSRKPTTLKVIRPGACRRGRVLGSRSPWADHGDLSILRREADALIRSPQIPDDPFQR